MIAFKRLVKAVFKFLGYQITKVENKNKSTDWFLFDDTCQIPNLSSLYTQIFGFNTVGTIVEVGAFDGIKFSNSSGLINRGWSAILIEPVPDFARACRKAYQDNPKVRVIQKAVSNSVGSAEINISGPLSSMNGSLTQEYSKLYWSKNAVRDEIVTVETTTLDELLHSEEVDKEFDLLIVDVEGFESEVFEGFQLDFWKPKVIIVELADFHPSLTSGRNSHFDLSNKIAAHNYTIIYKDAINTIYVTEELLVSNFKRDKIKGLS